MDGVPGKGEWCSGLCTRRRGRGGREKMGGMGGGGKELRPKQAKALLSIQLGGLNERACLLDNPLECEVEKREDEASSS